MKIGIGGGIGPLRAGISTRGVGVGVGPVHASTGYGRSRRGGDGDGGFAIVIAVFVGLLLVAWPYLLGTWVAVQLGAAPDSTARAVVGWICELLYLSFAGTVGIQLLKRRRAEQAAAERRARYLEEQEALRRQAEEARIEAERRAASIALSRAQDAALEALAERMRTHPGGIQHAPLKLGERLLAVFDEVGYAEPRSAYRGGPKVPKQVDMGRVEVTIRAVRFTSSTRRVEWRFDRFTGPPIPADALMLPVSNRQMVSGLVGPAETAPALHVCIVWGLAVAQGADVTVLLEQVAQLRDRIAAGLHATASVGQVGHLDSTTRVGAVTRS
jgi:hypothetical protein